ncbi:FUSC family protein [Pseudacidobacterium ailaaui]|uniref:FUSC family protein n=1 Tax=Pseudacidobacterium ailaaui TaxID=1382359 RepID=UPI000479F6A9|nr:FUSC family protein [Pseudacidobacterium ailaaui]
MATAVAAPRTDTRSFAAWFADFLRQELAPYPGRGLMVARMVIAATLTMVLVMTFRIPGGATGPLYAFLISRENLVSTARSAFKVVLAFGVGGAFVPLGAAMFASMPLTHFLWEAASIFLIFFLIRTLGDYSVASGVGLMATSAIAIWYLPGPAELNVERSLWQVAAPTLGAMVTFLVEAVFHAFRKEDQLQTGLQSRLQALEDLLHSYAQGRPAAPQTVRSLTQYAMVGVGSLRRLLAHSNQTPHELARMTALVSIVGRSMDFAAAMLHAHPMVPPEDRPLAEKMAQQLAAVRQCLRSGCVPAVPEVRAEGARIVLLKELEQMIALIPRVFEGSISLEEFRAFAHVPAEKTRVFVRDAFSNPEHVKFALSGCLAGMLCYVFYMGLGWPGLSTSVTTCVLTALSNIGASRQKQMLRLAGAVIGGFVFGLGAQVFVLPWLDSIAGFAVLFAAVSAVAAWIATASPRLSYCGLQIALAFYLIHVNDFTVQTSLTIGRDRAIGVLLGIGMMWLVFERLQPRTAVAQMVASFTGNLRLMADLTTLKVAPTHAASIARARRMRDQIVANFTAVHAQADAVPFEIGPRRAIHMAARDRIRRWQSMLRTFYLLDLALLQYRIFGQLDQLPEEIRNGLEEFHQSCAGILTEMAAHLEMQREEVAGPFAAGIQMPVLPKSLKYHGTSPQAGSIASITREMTELLERIRGEMLQAPLFALE